MSFDDLPLFAPPPTPAPIRQDVELGRVSERIAAAVVEFCTPGRTFHADELRQHVAARCAVAPGSADRILRLLRQQGRVPYRVLNRSKSLYLVLP